MSQRHRTTEVTLPPKVELRAQAHRERSRIRQELSSVAQQVSAGSDPEDVHEPGAAWKPVHHHDPDVGRQKAGRRRLRHWKTKMWKRRSNARQAKARALRPSPEA